MFAARVHMTPAESRALGRALGRVFGYLIREWGWGWGLTAMLGIVGVGWAAWTAPTWVGYLRDSRDWVLDWLDR